jgi:hypothetical protein
VDRSPLCDWDQHDKAHIAVHNVKPHEIEEFLENEPIRIETRGEQRRPVTAFDANRKTRTAYEKRRHEERQQEHN